MKKSLLAIGKDYEFQKRAQEVCEDLGLACVRIDDAELLADDEKLGATAKFALLSASTVRADKMLASMVQSTRFGAPNARLIVIAEKRLKPETAQFLKKSGAEVVIMEDEFLTTTKIDFIISQTLNTEMVPIKASEIIQASTPTFNLHHLLPLNEKMIVFHSLGLKIEGTKYQKMRDVGEIYIKGDDIDSFQKYVEANRSGTGADLESKCRAKYMNLVFTYKKLVLMLTDQSEGASYDQGKQLLGKLKEIASDLITNLAAIGESWDIVNNSSLGDMTAVDRAPAIAAAAGMLSLMSSIGVPEDVLIAGLIGDIGLLDMPPNILRLLRNSKHKDLDQEQRRLYEAHPLISINKVLARKLPIPDELKSIILNTHEQVDGKGFPNRPVASKIPLEAMLLNFTETVDIECRITMGSQRKNPKSIRQNIVENEIRDGSRFSVDFLTKIRSAVKD
jgi:HD-GYP domain-containing protein (c-di-GMP phosphodiesterase class II)